LKYRASRDGFSSQNCLTKCDGVSNTLTVIKTKNGNIFGVFVEKAWTSGTPVMDPKAFIISLINKENKPFKALISSTHTKGGYNYSALSCNSSYGPSFGYDRGYVDICIGPNSNAYQSSSSDFGCSFKHQDYPAASAKAKAILAGSRTFQTIDIEVFTKNIKI
jgi:hypothetical protein